MAQRTKKKRCSHDDCTKQAVKGGVCKEHGKKVMIRCSHMGCIKYARKGGVSNGHLEKSLVDAPVEVELLPHPAKGYEVTTVDVVAGRGGVIEVHYPSDDEEKIGAWIWKSSRIGRLGDANNVEETGKDIS
jgi:hypothetical protein